MFNQPTESIKLRSGVTSAIYSVQLSPHASQSDRVCPCPRLAAGVPQIYCAHTGLPTVAAQAPRIKFSAHKPVRQNVALHIFPQVKLYLYRHRVYHSSCAGIQPARPTPAPDPHQSTLRRMCNLYNAGLPLAILSSRRRWYRMPIRSGSKALILPMTRDYRWFQ